IGGARPKLTSSKSSGRFNLGRFSKPDTNDKTASKAFKEGKSNRSNS
uniref:Uncharacterized protein n=1 Tax=Ciona savignyi TaxID=51511 RepID=H2YD18_CIOSA